MEKSLYAKKITPSFLPQFPPATPYGATTRRSVRSEISSGFRKVNCRTTLNKLLYYVLSRIILIAEFVSRVNGSFSHKDRDYKLLLQVCIINVIFQYKI